MAGPSSATVSSMDVPEGPVFRREPSRSCQAGERASFEAELRGSPATLNAVARALVEAQFPLTIAPDVLSAVVWTQTSSSRPRRQRRSSPPASGM
jgi:hypothetical protein